MGEDMPDDPVTNLAEGAAQLHELYVAYLNAGFNERQALYLVGQLIPASVQAKAVTPE